MQEYTITMTSKGQFTMPAQVRNSLGVNQEFNKLILTYYPASGQAKIQRPVSFDEISSLSKGFIKKGIKPLENPRDFYQKRTPKL